MIVGKIDGPSNASSSRYAWVEPAADACIEEVYRASHIDLQRRREDLPGSLRIEVSSSLDLSTDSSGSSFEISLCDTDPLPGQRSSSESLTEEEVVVPQLERIRYYKDSLRLAASLEEVVAFTVMAHRDIPETTRLLVLHHVLFPMNELHSELCFMAFDNPMILNHMTHAEKKLVLEMCGRYILDRENPEIIEQIFPGNLEVQVEALIASLEMINLLEITGPIYSKIEELIRVKMHEEPSLAVKYERELEELSREYSVISSLRGLPELPSKERGSCLIL